MPSSFYLLIFLQYILVHYIVFYSVTITATVAVVRLRRGCAIHQLYALLFCMQQMLSGLPELDAFRSQQIESPAG